MLQPFARVGQIHEVDLSQKLFGQMQRLFQ